MCPTLRGVGLGWRPELAADLLRDPGRVDFVEVVAESCFVQTKLRDEARALSHVWPIALHGVKLSLGSADGIDENRARALGDLARFLGTPVVSEHVAFTRGREREIGHLTQLPRTQAAVAVVARNVARLRRYLPDVPLLLENVAFTLRWPDDEMDEACFYREIVAATGCPLLLDLGNLWANAVNEGRDPLAVLLDYPLDRVAMIHLAGGVWEQGFYFDTHAAPISGDLFALLGELITRVGPLPILVERDAEFGPFTELAAEIDRLRTIAADSARVAWTAREREAGPNSFEAQIDEALADRQAELAQALVGTGEPSAAMIERFGAVPLERSRVVLQRKRIDDSLPLLPRTAALGPSARELAMAAVEGVPRADRRAAIVDALRIAAAAAADPRMASVGKIDQLVLRARFVGPDRHGSVAVRRGPFVGRARLEGREVWVFKGPGASATVRLYQR